MALSASTSMQPGAAKWLLLQDTLRQTASKQRMRHLPAEDPGARLDGTLEGIARGLGGRLQLRALTATRGGKGLQASYHLVDATAAPDTWPATHGTQLPLLGSILEHGLQASGTRIYLHQPPWAFWAVRHNS